MDNTLPPSFDKFITKSITPVLADFWAPWCGPCRMMGPVLKGLAADWKDRITVIKVNTEERPLLAQRFEIATIPTLVLFKNGREVHRLSGAIPLDQLKNVLQGFI